ncbi:MAG: hypothetical protein A2W31_07865 [Planctomycetes bacterium RBG_16_64_10]|nr:MAG: hypothetical protein A2W31_07865 [Planctomycetes bacterium RBG_16_64_10]
MAEDYYKTLNVSRNASPAEIQRAYRDLARKYHPDLNPNDKSAKEKFQRVQAAFDVLNDPRKRENYDRYGSAFEGTGAGGPQGYTYTRRHYSPPGGEAVDFTDLFGERFATDAAGGFADIFKQFRRASASDSRQGRAPTKGADIEHEMELSLPTAVLGGEAQISIRRANGKQETLRVKIPAGIEDGKKIRLRGQGEPAPGGGPPGDILIRVRTKPHAHFRRLGKDLEVRVPVTLAEAAAGAKVDVPAPRGTITLQIPPGTSSGKRLRIKGQGVAPKGQEPGDLYAEIAIVLPARLDQEDRDWLNKIAQKHPQDLRSDLRW